MDIKLKEVVIIEAVRTPIGAYRGSIKHLKADKLGGYQGISLKDCFEMEYWELEQAKLKK